MVANLNHLEIDNVLKFKGYLIATKPNFFFLKKASFADSSVKYLDW